MRNDANALGPLTPYRPPNLATLQNYKVNRAGQVEVIWQPAYHYQTYPFAGATQMTFFQNPVGQGGLTRADTNMQAAGQFPAPQEFLVTGIQVIFLASKALAEVDIATAQTNWNDVNNVMMGSAFLQLFVGSKAYLDDGPLAKFPQQFRLTGGGWSTGNPTTDADTLAFVDYAVTCGRYYAITPVKLMQNQNFNVTLNFPAVIPVLDDSTPRIGVILDGFLYRESQ